jgi:hypothetical protein
MFLGFGSCVAVINQADCGDLWFNPTILSVQRPTNVFAGMSLGDFLGCLFLIIVDAILSKLLEKLFDKVLGKLKGKLSKWLKSTRLGKYLDDLGKKAAKLSAEAQHQARLHPDEGPRPPQPRRASPSRRTSSATPPRSSCSSRTTPCATSSRRTPSTARRGCWRRSSARCSASSS